MDGQEFNISGDRVNLGGTQINSGNSIRVGGSLINTGNLSLGDQTISTPAAVSDSLEVLRRYAALTMPADHETRVAALTDMLAGDMAVAEPDRKSAADRLKAIVDLLQESGSALNAGTTIVDSLAKIAKWIGPIATGVLAGFGILA